MKFHEKLRTLSAKINKSAAGRAVGIRSTTLSSYLSKGSIPRCDIALKIARALDVPVEWLIDDAQDMADLKPVHQGPLTHEDHARHFIHHAADTLSGANLYAALHGIAQAMASAPIKRNARKSR